ncbi:sigma-70 family RNA polymerase sigma factor [Lacticaseibacillus hulanensis]|uniref:sigma-70 family RNA polymerase sigma factor n=1 Tax=Lacticaseibacillus hulanensis TaxID=2493111 RepID=UPI0013E29217|nr:sigma-70 family RNA polymerase sigma factor [Lacticaseibacillus hulanensis]
MKCTEEELFRQNRGVIYHAVYRLGVKPRTELADELFAQGSEIYLRMLRRYHDPLDSDDDIRRFNRITGDIVFKALLRQQQTTKRNWQKFNATPLDSLVSKGLEPVHEEIPDSALLDFRFSDFTAKLSPRDLQVLYYKYTTELTNQQIAKRIHVSEATVSRKVRHMKALLKEMMD